MHDAHYVAVKIGVSTGSTIPSEAKTLRRLSESSSHASSIGSVIPTVMDEFTVDGPNGTHPCLVTIPAEGSLRQAKGYGALFPMPAARSLVANLVSAVAFLHSKGFVHGDIHLGNILIQMIALLDGLPVADFREVYGEAESEPVRRVDGQELETNCPPLAIIPLYLGDEAKNFRIEHARRLVLADFGEAFMPGVTPRLGKDSHVPIPFRSPEAHFEPDEPMDFASDIWSLATTIWHIMGMKNIFHNIENDQTNVAPQQVDVLDYDKLPSSWERMFREQVDGEDGEREPCPPLKDSFHECIQKFRLDSPYAGAFGEEEEAAFLTLMRGMLRFRPEERLTAEQVLKTEWMVRWALPALNATK